MSMIDDYRLARAAQMQRFEDHARGASGDQGSPEWDEFFGQGEYAGHGIETPITWKSWLVSNARSRRAEREAAEAEAAELAAIEAEIRAATITPAEVFRMRRDELDELARLDSPAARAELARREARRCERRQARQLVAA